MKKYIIYKIFNLNVNTILFKIENDFIIKFDLELISLYISINFNYCIINDT